MWSNKYFELSKCMSKIKLNHIHQHLLKKMHHLRGKEINMSSSLMYYDSYMYFTY